MSREPIFIVGAPRSGTTLLSAMLDNHSSLCCGPESQFFNKLNIKAVNEAFLKPNWPKLAFDEVVKITLADNRVVDLYEVNSTDYIRYLESHGAKLQTLLEGIMVPFMIKNEKQRWVEKTPDHILKLKLIRDLYPKSPIIRIIRDPRDSILSMARLPWTSHSFVENALIWKRWYLESERFLDTDTSSLTVRYEDLVDQPTVTLRQICRFIGEKFEPSMMDTSRSGLNVSTNNEPWKDMVNKPLSSGRKYRWKLELKDSHQSFSNFYLGRILKKHGYDYFRQSAHSSVVNLIRLFTRKIRYKVGI